MKVLGKRVIWSEWLRSGVVVVVAFQRSKRISRRHNPSGGVGRVVVAVMMLSRSQKYGLRFARVGRGVLEGMI